MRTFQFDDDGLRQVLEIAFKYGYVAGAEGTTPWETYNDKEKKRTLDTCTWNLAFGEIIALQEPEVYL